MVTVDAIVFAVTGVSAKVLFVKRGKEPFKGKWAFPGGFVGMEEELEDAVARELEEETRLKNVYLEQMHTFGKCGRDPRGRQITVAYMGIIEGSPPRVKGGDDAAQAKWFNIDKVPTDLAFDHNHGVKLAIEKLKKKAVYRRAIGKD